jgi:ferredoxin
MLPLHGSPTCSATGVARAARSAARPAGRASRPRSDAHTRARRRGRGGRRTRRRRDGRSRPPPPGRHVRDRSSRPWRPVLVLEDTGLRCGLCCRACPAARDPREVGSARPSERRTRAGRAGSACARNSSLVGSGRGLGVVLHRTLLALARPIRARRQCHLLGRSTRDGGFRRLHQTEVGRALSQNFRISSACASACPIERSS